jgi:GntR family transcriptional repressor for pyruvate dehydrogenase complex
MCGHPKRAMPQFQPVKPVRTHESIVHQIEEAIFRGDVAPGQRLPSERELVVQFGVSRASVREALRDLQSSGLLRSKPGDPSGGAEVQSFSSAALSRSLTALVRLEGLRLHELVVFRMVVEGSATYLAALHRQDEHLRRIRKAHLAMRRLVGGDQKEFARVDVEFHQAIAEASGNQLLRVCNEVAPGLVMGLIGDELARSSDLPALHMETCTRHARVLRMISKRDALEAAHLAKLYLAEYYGPYVSPNEAAELFELAHRAVGAF